MTENKLKPCPFCGGPVELENTIDGRSWWGVVCRNTRNRGGTCAIQIRPSASKEAAIERWNMRAPVSDERISLRVAANLAFNALHECKPAKGAEKQYSDAIQALQSALHDIAYTVNRTATPQQFADHLQREARAALASAPVAGEALASMVNAKPLEPEFAKVLADNFDSLVLRSDAAPQASASVRIGRATTKSGRVQSYAFEQTGLPDGEHALTVGAPQASEAVRDAAFEAVRKRLCKLPRYSFFAGAALGSVRRVEDRSGNWIEFDAAHALFDPVSVDAALSAQPGAQKEQNDE